MFAIEVLTHKGWVRMATRYRDKACAKSWVSFVKKFWHASRGRVVAV